MVRDFLLLTDNTHLFLHTCVLPQTSTVWRGYPYFFAMTGNQTRIGSVTHPQGTLILDALPTELPQLWKCLGLIENT